MVPLPNTYLNSGAVLFGGKRSIASGSLLSEFVYFFQFGGKDDRLSEISTAHLINRLVLCVLNVLFVFNVCIQASLESSTDS